MRRLSSVLPRILEFVGAGLLFAMMALTFFDVIGRYLFNRSIVGAFEVTEFMLATLIFIGIPLITLRGGHITVDLLDPFFGATFKAIRDRLVYLLWAAVLFYLTYQLWLKARDLVDVGEITQVLRWPVAPIAFIMAGLVFIAALIAVAIAITGAAPKPNDVEKARVDST